METVPNFRIILGLDNAFFRRFFEQYYSETRVAANCVFVEALGDPYLNLIVSNTRKGIVT